MNRRLLDHYGERVIFTEVKGKPNIITLRSTASNILKNFYSLKDVYHNAEAISTPEIV